MWHMRNGCMQMKFVVVTAVASSKAIFGLYERLVNKKGLKVKALQTFYRLCDDQNWPRKVIPNVLGSAKNALYVCVLGTKLLRAVPDP